MQWLLLPVPVYLQHVRKALEREDDRCRAYVYSFTRRRVIGECRALFLQEHVGDIVGNTSSGMLVMLQAAYNTDEPVDAVSAPKEVKAAGVVLSVLFYHYLPVSLCPPSPCRIWLPCMTCLKARAKRAM